ncbi:MAG: hypothetical protein LBH76_10425 [Propionibacteriaceae bacterium]|jgi:hypothetical protein|nr:hypothetical protein [Propionibacteriaceae bacterium]
MLAALEAAIPYQIQGLDCDNGSEFINHEVVGWTADAKGRRKRLYDPPGSKPAC